jgi:integrase
MHLPQRSSNGPSHGAGRFRGLSVPRSFALCSATFGEPYHLMVLIAACLGLRASDLVGLQWQEFDWETLTVTIRRGVDPGRLGETKNGGLREAAAAGSGVYEGDPRVSATLSLHTARGLRVRG